ncbi:MAG: hypothetical protein FWH53_04255 [Leptospirales bacterium]|nr:hypothetical protein [Leptospirales bacterium]
MKKLLITILFIFYQATAFSAEGDNTLISDIIDDIDNYKNKTISINLKLKHVDKIFEKIVFYDTENIDIEFDISGKAKKKQLSKNLINIHEGMIYRVTFTVIGSGTIGGLTGDLHEFVPLIFDKIPIK